MTTTAPGSASACTRAAILGASPNTSPAASTTTAPVSIPMRATSSGRPEPGVLAVQLAERSLDGERGAHRAFGIVLLRDRVAEERHDPVAELLQHVAAQPGHRRRGLVEIGVDEVAPVLGVKLRRKTGRPDEIAEHHRDRATFGVGAQRSQVRRRGGVLRRPASGCSGAALANLVIALMRRLRCPNGTPNFSRSASVSSGSTSTSISCSRKVASYWSRPMPLQPLADVHGRAPHGLAG